MTPEQPFVHADPRWSDGTPLVYAGMTEHIGRNGKVFRYRIMLLVPEHDLRHFRDKSRQ